MYSSIPNMAQTFGYINASWTLRADLTAEYVCRLLNHMDGVGASVVTPTLRPEDHNMPQGLDRRFHTRLHAAHDAPIPQAGLRALV